MQIVTNRFLKACEWMKRENSIPSDSKFCVFIGMEQSTFSTMKTGKANVGLEKLIQTLSRAPEISSEWVLFGRGEMITRPAVPLSASNDVTGVMQKLISCMEEKEKLQLENAELKSGAAAYSYKQKSTELKTPKPSKQ